MKYDEKMQDVTIVQRSRRRLIITQKLKKWLYIDATLNRLT